MKKKNNQDLVSRISDMIASQILSEEGEAYRQAVLTKKIKKLDLKAKEGDEEAIQDEQEDDPFAEEETEEEAEEEEAEEEEAEPEAEEKQDDEKPEAGSSDDEKFVVAPPETIPAKITVSQIEKQINNLRAGQSLKDKDISTELENYFQDLGEGEKQALFIYLASLASILTGGSPGDLAPAPEQLDVDIEPEQKVEDIPSEIQTTKSDIDSPIVVGESSDISSELLFMVESLGPDDKHRCINGKMVPFGSEKCILDLIKRIDDISDQRDHLARSSADRASLNGTLKFLRQKKRKAEKVNKAKIITTPRKRV